MTSFYYSTERRIHSTHTSRAGGGILPEDTEVRVPQGILDDAQAELLGRSGLTDSEAEAEED